MEPNETIYELAERWADEDAAEARAIRFAQKIERLGEKLGLPRHRVAAWLLNAGNFAAFPATKVA